MPGANPLRSPTRTRRGQRLTFERLEDRLTPATQLVSTDSGFSAALPAGAEVVGQSADGRYVLFQSTNTNVIRGQLETFQNSMDLFWQDTATGERLLVSAEQGSGGLRAGGVVPSIPGQVANAVLSGDGKSVAFVSTRNANAYTSVITPAGGGTGVILDNGDASADVFYWNSDFARGATTAGAKNDFLLLLSLGSGIATDGGINYGTAAGYTNSATNPAISTDGSVVTFVSRRNAGFFAALNDAQPQLVAVADNGDNTPDVFQSVITQFTINPATGATTVNAAVPLPYTSYNDPFVGIAAFGLFASAVEVDPLGRYLSGDGKSVVVSSNLSADRLNQFSPPSPPGSIEVYHISFNQFPFPAVPGQLPSIPTVNLITSAPGQPGVSVGARAFNAIIPSTNPNAVVFSATVPGGAGGVLVPGYQNNNNGGPDLYFRQIEGLGGGVQPPVLDPTILVTSVPGNPAAGANGQLDLSAGAFSVSEDGTWIAFASAATNLVNGVSDKNGVFDVFARNIVNGSVFQVSVTPAGTAAGNGSSNNPRISRDGLIVGFLSTSSDLATGVADTNNANDVFVRNLTTQLTTVASAIPGGTATGNGASTGVLLSGNLTAGLVAFNSTSTNLVNGANAPAGVNQVYTVSLPIGGQGAERTVAISGGRSGQAGLAVLTGDGTLVPGAPVVPFPGFNGELRVASGDVNGDGIADLIVGAGPGTFSQVKVYDGVTGTQLFSFFPYEQAFTGGVFVAAGDFNGDGLDDIVVGAGAGGGPRVKIFSGLDGSIYADLFVFEAAFRGGIRVAAGDVNGDGIDDLVIGAGIGGGPRVSVFSGAALPGLVELLNFFAFEPTLRNGVYVGAGDVNGDGFADLATGAGPGGAPRVIVYNSFRLLNPVVDFPEKFADFFAFPESTRDGVRVALRRTNNGSGTAGLVTGIGGGGPQIRAFSINPQNAPGTPALLSETFAFGETAGLFGAWVG